ncbi:tyrosine protein phosphatase PTP1 Ecym_6455 [Eremothecium cymbalariae DBVPG|uniref:protein-tyrosine-phosphatase n=1 Tax=Eremothecium cymbalariae (strain CBS 270.75 / DBVPG 7215 / KCTC 17166 / NRRL Y-17582) TaxID=931890 RepID=G8JUP6_ERECY|nr:hypothetical protein Ecym_6455 [Eremothecium cymbalariae DBVPG\
MQEPWYLNQSSKNLVEKFKYIQSQEDERLREATINAVNSKWSFGTSVDLINEYRNRYVNIIPFERNRVKLDVISGNDYINASYAQVDVPGQSVKRGYYVATQGPTKRTWEQFWEMCYQQCPGTEIVIIMVTPLIEHGREKCYLYWPKEDSGNDSLYIPKIQSPSNRPDDILEFETDLVLKRLKETKYPSYTKTLLSLTPGVDKYPPKRVHHFYFDKWRDMTRPDEIRPILELSRDSHRESSPGNPIIVHCSAGVGRTGTFITLDHLIHNTADFTKTVLSNYKHDLIEQIVLQLRSQRLKMVQLLEQYEFIYHIAEAVFASRHSERITTTPT